VTVPTIHLNGTSKDALIESLHEAILALDTAIKAVCETAPNGRDYYPQGPAAFTAAQDEHTARLAGLDAVKGQLEDLAAAIYEGGHKHDGR
jgi:hypothetical protein